jgi:hypothetical protein
LENVQYFVKEFLMSLWYKIWRQGIENRVAAKHSRRQSSILVVCILVLLSIALVACSDGTKNTNTTHVVPTATPTPVPVALAKLSWCGKPQEVFRDQAASSVKSSGAQTGLGAADDKPKTLTDWSVVKANLGFTLYLPQTLPTGTCLLSVSSSLRDPVFGSNFTIAYVLPNNDSLSFSQAPLRVQHTVFQCSVSQDAATPVTAGTTAATGTVVATSTAVAPAPTKVAQEPLQICNGARDQTSIVFANRGTTSSLQQLLQNLQPNVDWMPAK